MQVSKTFGGALTGAVLAFHSIVAMASAEEWPARFEGHGGPVKSVAISSDGRSVLSASFDYAAILWSIEGGEAKIVHRLIGHEAAVNDAHFANGTFAVSVSDDGSIALWDLETGEMASRIDEGGDKMLSVAVNEDGSRALAASWDRNAYLYAIEEGKLTRLAKLGGHRGNVNSVDFLPDGTGILTASYDGGIRLFDATSGELEREIYAHGWGVNVIKAMPDGKTVLFGATDGAVGLVSIETGEEVKVLPPHERPVLSLALSTDGTKAASGGGDGKIRFMSTLDWALEEEFENPYGPVWGMAITPDNTTVLYAGLDDHVNAWQVSPRKPFEPIDNDFPRRFQVSDTDDPGELQFARKCSVCHTLKPDDANRAGPTLYKLFGRKAGSLPGYPYSDALKRADFTWTEETVSNLFDHGPDVVTPGSKMPIQRLKDHKTRDALVAFLKRATDPAAQSEEDVTKQKEGEK
ncbi:c-type cytochrome [Stappia sediminis]|nr:c-type cytochrome [Stappia sediminis]